MLGAPEMFQRRAASHFSGVTTRIEKLTSGAGRTTGIFPCAWARGTMTILQSIAGSHRIDPRSPQLLNWREL